MQNNKPFFLFHSARSKYSNEVLSFINDKVSDKFTIVNIDNPNYTIPQFVDRVPLIYITSSKEIIVDDSITLFLDFLIKQNVEATPVTVSTKSIEYLSDVNKSISNTFSFISENDDTITPLGYGILNGSTNKIPNELNESSSKSNKLDSQVFENYKSQRDNDIAQFMPPRTI